MIDFTTGVKYIVAKGKNGHLSVVSSYYILGG